MASSLILGIGNRLLCDEGAGVLVVEFLAGHHPNEPGIEYLDGGTLSFTLAGSLAAHPWLIVIDAANLKAAPGSIRVFEGPEMDIYLTGSRSSVHEVSLGDLLDIARLSDSLPKRRALIGIQPERIDWDESPTPAVAAAIEPAAREVLRLHREWQADAEGEV